MMTPPRQGRNLRLGAIRFTEQTDLLNIQQKTIAVVGTGTLGFPVLEHLAMHGARLLLIDRGVVELHNLGTQGFTASQVGQPKVEARRERVRQLNPNCAVQGLYLDIEHLGLGTLQHVDMILSCLDSFAARLILHELAWRLGIPCVDAALDGSGKHLYGRVAAYDPRQPEAPCILCSWDDTTYNKALAVSGITAGCPTWVELLDHRQEAPPTLAMSSIAGVVGGLQTIQALRLLLGDTAVAGRELIIDVQHTLLHMATCQRTPRCRFDHRVWPLHTLAPGTWHQPVQMLFARAEMDLGSAVTLHPYRRTLATQLLCTTCQTARPIARFVHALQRADCHCACGRLAQPVGFSCLAAFDRRQAIAFRNTTWHQLGLPANEVVTASTTHGQECHYIINA
jgi:molybdopterin/thiamine biosynthesis adenylyltransferase